MKRREFIAGATAAAVTTVVAPVPAHSDIGELFARSSAISRKDLYEQLLPGLNKLFRSSYENQRCDDLVEAAVKHKTQKMEEVLCRTNRQARSTVRAMSAQPTTSCGTSTVS